MLVLSRRVGETIYIGDDITVTVARMADGEVTLGITAPRETPIARSEVAHRPRKKALPTKDITPPRRCATQDQVE